MNVLNFRRVAIVLTLVWLGLFVLVPHVLVVLTSVMSPDPQHLAVWPLTLASWERLFEPVYAEVFWRSVAVDADHGDLLGVGVSVCVHRRQIAGDVARGAAVSDDCAVLDE